MNKLYVLGTGQAVVKHYHNTCFVLSDGEDYFLVDGGGGGDILRCVDQMNVYSGRVRHTARSFRTRLPEFEDTLSVIWTHPVPVKQVSASGTGCYC